MRGDTDRPQTGTPWCIYHALDPDLALNFQNDEHTCKKRQLSSREVSTFNYDGYGTSYRTGSVPNVFQQFFTIYF